MANKIHLQAPTLQAELIGEIDQDVGLALFRGIPYAFVEKRWTHSRTKHSLEIPFNATEFGPRCCQGNGPVLVSGGSNDPVPGDDEFNCLNLNIAVPKEALPSLGNDSGTTQLPVMVWIHGYVYSMSFCKATPPINNSYPSRCCLLSCYRLPAVLVLFVEILPVLSYYSCHYVFSSRLYYCDFKHLLLIPVRV
jgi:hypothetical protein